MTNTASASPGLSRPHLCIQEGLDCTTCTGNTARELARACPGLAGKSVAQIFVQIYADPACSPMHRDFARAYAEALAPRRGMSVLPLADVAAA